MKFVMSGEKYIEGFKNFMGVYYKEELKEGSLRKTIIVYAICLAVLGGFCLLLPGMKELFLVMVVFLLGVTVLISLVIVISLVINKKKKKTINLDRVEQVYEDHISVNAYFISGSVDSGNYNYSDIKKVIEVKEFFYLFLDNNLAIPLYKDEHFDKDSFVNLIKSKNIKIKEYKVK